MKYDFIIVGAGISGCVMAERLASHFNKPILIIESRNHIAGNCYDYRNEHNILVHKYGPHIFHTNKEKVWKYLSNFTSWEEYEHKVLASIEGKLINIPFNLNSLYKCFPNSLAQKLEEKLLSNYKYGEKIPILTLQNSQDEDLLFLSNYVYEKVFLGYTVKQWEMSPEALDNSVMSRVPFLVSRDDRYFSDKYQALPKSGYTNLCNNILNNKNINILLATNFNNIKKYLKYKTLIFTGKIDSYFEYRFGELGYRDLYFEFLDYEFSEYQPVSQVNYPCNNKFTRITEFKHFYKTKNLKTTIAKEYSIKHDSSKSFSPYYPIPNEENLLLYKKYREEAANLKNIVFAGRLGDYKYYNMDESIARALEVADKLINI